MATEKDFHEEIEKCKDPVYFYENYFLVDGKKPKPLTELQKDWIRKWASGGDLYAEIIKNLGR